MGTISGHIGRSLYKMVCIIVSALQDQSEVQTMIKTGQVQQQL